MFSITNVIAVVSHIFYGHECVCPRAETTELTSAIPCVTIENRQLQSRLLHNTLHAFCRSYETSLKWSVYFSEYYSRITFYAGDVTSGHY